VLPDDPRQQLADTAALWSVDQASHDEVIEAACNALVDDLDTPGLRELAGIFHAEAHYRVPEVLPVALAELALPAGNLAAATVMARRCLNGDLAPRELARWMHRTFGHGESDDLEVLVVLDDCYDVLDYTAETESDLDDRVREACRVLVTRNREP